MLAAWSHPSQSLPHWVIDGAQDMPLLGQHQHSSVSFPLGDASSMASGNFPQADEGYGFCVTLRCDVLVAAASLGSGTVALPCSLPLSGPCMSLAALTSDVAAVQLDEQAVWAGNFFFLLDLFSMESDC